jgi:hypothetical protein
MVGDAFVPAAQRPAGACRHDGVLVVIPGEGTDCFQVGEEGDGGDITLAATRGVSAVTTPASKRFRGFA